jgi:hypothetical protein
MMVAALLMMVVVVIANAYVSPRRELLLNGSRYLVASAVPITAGRLLRPTR